MLSATELQPPSPSLCVLHTSLPHSASAARFTVSVGAISGIPVCGRGLVLGSPSICHLSQSCTLLLSLPLPTNLSLYFCCHTAKCPSFCSALLHVPSLNKGPFLSLSHRGNYSLCFLSFSKIWKWILVAQLTGHSVFKMLCHGNEGF